MSKPEPSPAEQLVTRAAATLRPGDELVFLTDALSYPTHVVVAIAKPFGAWAMQIHKSEYKPEDALRLAELMGFHQMAPSAIERARKAKHAQAK